MELFESYDRRIDKILGVLKEYGIGSVEECRDICAAAGLDPYKIVKDVQPIAFENAGWAYTVGAAIAIKTNARTAVEAAKAIGIGLQSFCIPGSVAEDRKVGRGHGNLAAMLLQDETSVSASSPAMNPLPLLKALSVLSATPIKPARYPFALS
jgi:hypothetical protein